MVDPSPQAVKVAVVGTRLDFRFPRITGAAGFVDAGIATLVFDTRDTIDPAELKGVLPQLIEDATVTREGKVALVRLRLAGQPLTRLFDDGTTWSLSFGEQGGKPAEPLVPARAMDEQGQTIVAVPLRGMTGVHWLEAGPSGLPIAVATATGPVRVTSKPYQFVEFGLLPSRARAGRDPALGRCRRPRRHRTGPDRAHRRTDGDAGRTRAGEGRRGGQAAASPARRGAMAQADRAAVRDQERPLQREIIGASRARKSETRLALARSTRPTA